MSDEKPSKDAIIRDLKNKYNQLSEVMKLLVTERDQAVVLAGQNNTKYNAEVAENKAGRKQIEILTDNLETTRRAVQLANEQGARMPQLYLQNCRLGHFSHKAKLH